MSEMLAKLLSYRMNLLSGQIARSCSTAAKSNTKRQVELAYACFQPTRPHPKEPPLVILHGLFGSKKNWDSLARQFSKSGRRVITIDARNHGESSHTPSMDYLSMSEDVEKLLDMLSIRRAIILGHSMGGKTAMCLALNKPYLVDALIVEDIAPVRSPMSSTFPQYIAAMKSVEFDQKVETLGQARYMADQQLRKTFPDTFMRAFILTNIRQGSEGFGWKINLDAVESNLDSLAGFPELNKTYDGQVLFIGGANSSHIKGEDEPAIQRLFPRASVEHIPGAGHWVHSDKPKELLARVQRFIGDHSLES